MVSSQEVMRLDRKVYSASDVDPNHAVQRKGFPQVSVFDLNEGNELTLMVKLKYMRPITSPIGKSPKNDGKNQTTTTICFSQAITNSTK